MTSEMKKIMKKLDRDCKAIRKKYAARKGLPRKEDKKLILGLLEAMIGCRHQWPCLECEMKASRVYAELSELWEKI